VRTYERGVEAETLACGSGSVSVAILLTTWAETAGQVNPVDVETSSGRVLRVRLAGSGSMWKPSLSGEARVIYQGQLSEI
jgi:diaminopimelate epimerase